MARKRTTPVEVLETTQQRRNRALELRLGGMPQQQIAVEMNCSKQNVSRWIKEALADITRENAEEYLELELSRLDALLATIWPDIVGRKKGYEWKIDRALAIMEQRAKLTGTYKAAELRAIAAAKGGVSVETSSMIGRFFDALEAVYTADSGDTESEPEPDARRVIDLDSFPLSRKQIGSIVLARRYRTSIWSGAVRSGKTIASIVAFFGAVIEAPDTGLILICGRTLQTIERNIIEPMQDEQVFGPWAAEVHHTRGSSIAVIFGRTVHLIGASDVRAEGKLRGLTACLALVDEATLLPESFWMQLQARLSVAGARCLATTNPDNPRHYLKVNFIDRQNDPELRLKAFEFTLEDNPSLSADYVSTTKAAFTGLFYLRNILGQWVTAEGGVYDCYDPARHIISWATLPAMQWMIGVGVDHGTTNPTAAVLLGLGADNRLYAVDEWRHESSNKEARWSNVQLSQGLREWLAGPHHPLDDPDSPPRVTCPVIVDQAAADYRVQLKQDGLQTYPAEKNVLYGIRTVSGLLGSGKLLISDRCWGVIKELPGYVWDTKATTEGKDQPVKQNDHSLDGLRYGITSTERKWRRHVDMYSAAA